MRFEKAISRRSFLERSLTAAAALGFPSVVPARVFGPSAPNNMIQVGQIGCGRIARVSEFPAFCGTAMWPGMWRCAIWTASGLADAKSMLEQAYAKKFGAGNYAELKTYGDYREMLQDKSIDAVVHQHARPLARADCHGSSAGRQGHLSAEARVAHHQGRPPDGGYRQADRPNLSAGKPAALRDPTSARPAN